MKAELILKIKKKTGCFKSIDFSYVRTFDWRRSGEYDFTIRIDLNNEDIDMLLNDYHLVTSSQLRVGRSSKLIDIEIKSIDVIKLNQIQCAVISASEFRIPEIKQQVIKPIKEIIKIKKPRPKKLIKDWLFYKLARSIGKLLQTKIRKKKNSKWGRSKNYDITAIGYDFASSLSDFFEDITDSDCYDFGILFLNDVETSHYRYRGLK